MNVGIIGVGRLGLAYALLFEKAGFNVFASSYKQEYVTNLQNKITDSVEPGIDDLLKNSSSIQFTTDNEDVIKHCDIIYVMVATPSNAAGDYDVSAVESVVNDFISYQDSVDNKILVIGSTVNPGTCNRLQESLSHRGVKVVYCPTFSAQGSVLNDIKNPHTLSLGTTDQSAADRCKSVFSKLVESETPIYVVDPTTAEILKLAGNCRATMEISFANMIGQILVKNGLEHDIETASRYLSFIKLRTRWKYGFGYGGPCYPRDNRSFVHYTQKIGMDYPLGRLIDEFNESHVEFLTNYFVEDNAERLPFYFEYVSYKKGVAIFEESHQLKVCKKLLDLGFDVYIELTEFLMPVIISELSNKYESRVQFVRPGDLECAVYKINI